MLEDKLTSQLRNLVSSRTSGRTAGTSRLPKISIVMPAYNQVKFIERSILSVLNQDYANLELIVIDGGSTDGTVDIIRKYASEIHYWTSEKDGGQANALNKGLEKVTGEIVGWQNSDDVYFPGAFEAVSRAYTAARSPRLISGVVCVLDEHDRVESLAKFARPSVLRLTHEGFVMSSQSVFWSAQISRDLGGYREDLHHAMDVEFWIRVLRKYDATFLPRVLGGFRVHPGTKTSVAGAAGTSEYLRICAESGVSRRGLRFRMTCWALRLSRIINWYVRVLPRLKMSA